jgi:hypothetical protein
MTNAPLAASSSPSSGDSATNPLRLLLWLRWTLLWRAYSRQRLRVVGAIVMVVCLAPVSIGGAVLCFTTGRDYPGYAPSILMAVLTAAWALWLITPLLGFPLNESYDPSRLFVYPVPMRTIFTASVLGSFFELTTLLALPIFLAMIALFSTSILAALIAIVAVSLFLIHTFATAQMLMLLLIGFLRSRRFRDVTVVLFPVIAIAIYVGQQAAIRGMGYWGLLHILDSPIWRIIGYLPPGWAAQAASYARTGHYDYALLYLVLLVFAAVIPIGIASLSLQSLYLGDRGPSADSKVAPAPKVIAAPSASAPSARGAAHTEIAALAGKEWTYFVREPQYKALAVNMLYTVVVLFFAVGLREPGMGGDLFSSSDSGSNSPISTLIGITRAFALPTALLLATLPLTFNVFGGDASAITVLVSFPTPRRSILLGKNLALAPLVVGLCVAGAFAGEALLHVQRFLPAALAWSVLATPVILGAGNLVSVRFPRRLIVRGQRWQRGGQVAFGSGPTGCGYLFVYLLCYMAAYAALTPVFVAVALPIIFSDTTLLAITLPLAACYSIIVYIGALTAATSLLERRESEIVAALTPEDGS